MVLEPLAEPAVKELTASVLRADPDAGLLKMVEQADGNPFFLVEMLSGRAGPGKPCGGGWTRCPS
jgi:hypothetical protein